MEKFAPPSQVIKAVKLSFVAAIRRQEASVDVKVEAHIRHVHPIETNHDGTIFPVCSSKMPLHTWDLE